GSPLQTAPRARLLEVLTSVSDDLSVGGMVGRLDPDDPSLECGDLSLQVAQEMQLRRRRTDDQDLAISLQAARHPVEEAMLVIGVSPLPDLLVLRVTV